MHPSHLCEKALEYVDVEMGQINPYNIYTPPCSNVTGNSGKQHIKRNVRFMVKYKKEYKFHGYIGSSCMLIH
jgi:hypothetical protein